MEINLVSRWDGTFRKSIRDDMIVYFSELGMASFLGLGILENTVPSGQLRAIAPSMGAPRVPTMIALFLYGQSMMSLEGNRSSNCLLFCRSGRTQGGGQLVGHH
jgi:hypothetical protein